MKSFQKFLEEGKVVEDGDMIVVTVPKAVAMEMQDGTFDVSETDYGEMKGNKLHLYKKELKSLMSRLEDNYHKDHGLETVKPAVKRKMLELAKSISKYA